MNLQHTLLALTATLVTSSLALADGMVKPLFEVGAGTETSIDRNAFNVLLRVRTGLVLATDAMTGPDQFVIAQIDGSMSVNPTDAGDRIPYMNIRFIPVGIPTDSAGPAGSTLDAIASPGTTTTFQILPAGIHRDTRIGRDYAVRVSAIGLDVSHVSLVSEDIGFFIQAAAEMIGMKLMEQNGGYGTLLGFRLGGVAAEIGFAFNIAQSFMVRIGIGGRADVSFGSNDAGATIQSDREAYVKLVLSLTQYIQVFSQLGILSTSDSNFDARTLYQFMGGLNINFL